MKHLVKYLLIATVAVLVGIGCGYAYQIYESTQVEEKFYWGQWETSESTPIVPFAFVRDSDIHDFGTVAKGQLLSHDFVIENQGLADLEVWIDDSPTGAITVDLDSTRQMIRPSYTFPISVTLDTNKLDGPLTESLTIMTNETQPLTLTLKAKPE